MRVSWTPPPPPPAARAAARVPSSRACRCWMRLISSWFHVSTGPGRQECKQSSSIEPAWWVRQSSNQAILFHQTIKPSSSNQAIKPAWWVRQVAMAVGARHHHAAALQSAAHTVSSPYSQQPTQSAAHRSAGEGRRTRALFVKRAIMPSGRSAETVPISRCAAPTLIARYSVNLPRRAISAHRPSYLQARAHGARFGIPIAPHA